MSSATFITTTASSTFEALVDSWAEPATSEVNVLGFPGGDSVAVSIAGQREITRTFGVYFTTVALYRVFRDQRGKQGSLLVGSWDTAAASAVLKQVSPDPPGNDGSVHAVAQFVLY